MVIKMSDFLNNDEKINCPSCGGENKATNTFCMSCGERIVPIEKPEAPQPIPPAAPQPIPPAAPQPIPPTAPDANTIERAEGEVVKSTPWYNEGNEAAKGNPYQNTGSAYKVPPTYAQGGNKAAGNVSNGGNSGLAIASLVCGIVSFACCYFSFFVSIAGLIMGIISLVKKQNGRGMAIAGIIISSLSILFYIIVIGAIAIFSESVNSWLQLIDTQSIY
ncbi:MAG: DUF4190 domain-containing protein [Lachnospiraceae bacterium]|nr:DUF4190 domain-containing protein [Lachnospiraceae bacterium]